MSDITSALTVFLLSVGSLFCLLAAIGIVTMPDLYTRMQAASKSATLGVTSLVLGAAVYFEEADVTVRCLLTCVFFVVTIPAASHLVARAAYRSHEPLSPDTTIDELHEFAHPAESPKSDETIGA